MGKSISKAIGGLFSSKQEEARIVMIGLDSAGKTTVLYRLKLGEVVMTTPTIGFNVESVQYKNVNLAVWDLGGQEMVRPLWKHYYKHCKGIILVIDASDKNEQRLKEIRDELFRLAGEKDVKNAPVLILNNKKDVKGSMSTSEVTEALDLYELQNEYYIQNTCATMGTGLFDGMEWLVDSMNLK
ncbi:adp-ribosylation factor [Anaeramoeba flamelloides]|uniref:Adp-ribosylation factor n=1 Tax=Anaeramoeba flamelloides TaxID=1746091 RepID=A0ABQ8Z5E8_9EUKA|nr:adp-ribosylation factor [Anaeramoeba flamelloides]